MKNITRIAFVFSLILAIHDDLKAQAKPQKKALTDKANVQVGIAYTHDNVYMGRKDSLRISYLTPEISYNHISGLFLKSSLSYIASPGEGSIDLISFEAGYDVSVKNIEAGVSATKHFYNNQSTNVRSAIQGSLDAYTGVDFGSVKTFLQGSVNFSNLVDYAISFGLERPFYAMDDKVEISPAFTINAGTQNAYRQYYKDRRYSGTRKTKKENGIIYDISAELSGASNFKILDCELSVPVNYTANNFTFYVTPSIAIPTNASEVTATIKPSAGGEYSKTYTEKLGSSFYFLMGVNYKFQ